MGDARYTAVVFANWATTIGRHLQRTVRKWMHCLYNESSYETSFDIVDQIREEYEANQKQDRAIAGARELEEKAILCLKIVALMYPKLEDKEREDKALSFMHLHYSDLIMMRSKLERVKSETKVVLKSRYDLILER